MSVDEMKKEVIIKVSNLNNENVLQEILELLNVETKKEKRTLSNNYDAIKEQYGDVLKKLAQ